MTNISLPIHNFTQLNHFNNDSQQKVADISTPVIPFVDTPSSWLNSGSLVAASMQQSQYSALKNAADSSNAAAFKENLEFLDDRPFAEAVNDPKISQMLLSEKRSLSFYKELHAMGWSSHWFNTPISNHLLSNATIWAGHKLDIPNWSRRRYDIPTFTPPSYSLIHKYIREQNPDISFIQKILEDTPKKEIYLGTHFYAEEIEECFQKTEEIPKNLQGALLAQRGCSTMVQLPSQEIISLPGTNALELQKRINQTSEEFHSLVIYANRAHANIELDGMALGFYADEAPTHPWQELPCVVVDDTLNSRESEQTNEMRLYLPISKEQFQSVENHIHKVKTKCSERKYIYRAAFHNCVDFAQSVFASAGYSGSLGRMFPAQQIAHRFHLLPRPDSHFLAAKYILFSAYGFPPYLAAELGASPQTVGYLSDPTVSTSCNAVLLVASAYCAYRVVKGTVSALAKGFGYLAQKILA